MSVVCTTPVVLPSNSGGYPGGGTDEGSVARWVDIPLISGD
jgi:hypothetical protein